MDLNRIFAVALKHYRERAGMSQEEMAGASGLDRTYISQLERELKSPTLTTLQKLSACLGLEAHRLLREPFDARGPRIPGDYMVSDRDCLFISREGGTVEVPANVVTSAINVAHELIDSMYAIDLDIAAVLGMRNLSAFIGELYAAAVVKTSAGRFRSNPHQDGYPDLLLMDEAGRKAWRDLEGRTGEKGPFSPFPAGGVEIKATCGNIPSPEVCYRRGIRQPGIGFTRIGCMTGYNWRAHHRETNNLTGLLWDFIGGRPRIAALFYSHELEDADWGKIVHPRDGGGKTTSLSVMNRSGIRKMYAGWICVLSEGGYREFLNRKNKGERIR